MKKIQKDKILHFLAGFWIYVIASVVFTPFIGLLATSIIGAGKELIYDLAMKKGTPEVLDFVWTVIPALVLFLISIYNL